VDHFKKYNDRYGHPAGDECLKALAQVLKTHLRRPGDLIARYGGEEFIAVMPNTELHHAVMVAERIREELENLHIRHESSNASRVLTISIGVSCTRAGFDKITTGLISGADAALYQAKREGRNRVCAQIVG
jgi:diguanylate cyclase (GGDEF)-like protein